MNQGPFYAYDVRGQFQQPLFIAYDESHVAPFAEALGIDMDNVFVSRTRLHPYERDRYKSMGSEGIFAKPRTTP